MQMDHTLLQSVRTVDLPAEVAAAAEASLATEMTRHAKEPQRCPRTLFKSARMGLWTKLRPCVPNPNPHPHPNPHSEG